jgi:glutathione synthase/RimK-type ligase-like ATP-grasp enzyme
MSLPHFVILKNEISDDHQVWVDSCIHFKDKLTFDVVDITKNDWLDHLSGIPRIDFLLAKPGGLTAPYKQLYDERVIILSKELGHKIFPSLDEILIYENKRYLSYWLKAHGLPHPSTYVFYNQDEAENFIRSSSFPIVAKINIGASGSGVEILKDRADAHRYIQKAFKKGITSQSGPRLDKGKIISRAYRKLRHPVELKNRISIYRSISNDPQKGFVFFQEYIPHSYEWRVVRIGDSFFAHKKIVRNEKASGLLLKGYETPPLPLLNFVKEITDRFRFYSQAVDLFETPRGFLVNEMQCIFGQSDPYQMMIDGKPGRYIHINDKWVFEEGMFNTNKSFDLRIQFLLSQI